MKQSAHHWENPKRFQESNEKGRGRENRKERWNRRNTIYLCTSRIPSLPSHWHLPLPGNLTCKYSESWFSSKTACHWFSNKPLDTRLSQVKEMVKRVTVQREGVTVLISIGSLSDDDGNAEFALFYCNSLNLIFQELILKDCIQVHKNKKNIVVMCSRPP